MSPIFAIDTAAMISLGHTGLVKKIPPNINLCISETVLKELKDIAKGKDKASLAAKKWLKVLGQMKVIQANKQATGEEELFEICKKNNAFLVTDDLKAIKRFERTVRCYYSVHMVYILYRKKVISKGLAMTSIEKMRLSRDWGQNLISVTARALFGI